MKKWGEVYIDASQIVDLKQFNKGFDFFKSAFNGGIDRTMQPEDAYNSSRVKDNAFLKAVAVIRGDMSALRDNATGSLGFWKGLSYNTYSGGWITVDEFTETNMKTGFIAKSTINNLACILLSQWRKNVSSKFGVFHTIIA